MMKKTSRKALEALEQYTPPEPDNNWENVRSLPLTVVIPALAFLYGASFQLGYFFVIGMEFLPLIGPTDIIFAVGAVMPWYFLLSPLFAAVQSSIKKYVSGIGSSRFAQFAISWTKWEQTLIYVAIAIFVFTNVNLIRMMLWPALLVTYTLSTMTFLLLKEEYRAGRLVPSTVFWFAIHTSILMLTCGSLYGNFLAGHDCYLRTNDNTFWKAKYLRSVESGHLARYNGQTIYIAKDQLKEMVCSPASGFPEHGKYKEPESAGRGI